jgi:NADH-quinone oxidoreductase subunit M
MEITNKPKVFLPSAPASYRNDYVLLLLISSSSIYSGSLYCFRCIFLWDLGSANSVWAIKFFLYTLFGSVLMLVGILMIYFNSGLQTFDILELTKNSLAPGLQNWIFLLLFMGFAIKVPMFPFHTWLPDAHTEAPTAGSVLLAGILLKMGSYGFIRIGIPVLPEASKSWAPAIAILAVIGIIYGALASLIRRSETSCAFHQFHTWGL